jgi:phosphohistidine phosphatase
MKRLIIVRHAKSSWADPGQRDFDRPLNARGERSAPEMAKRLEARGMRPQLIVASGARRAQATAKLMAEVFGYPKKDIETVDELYEASPRTWLEQIGALPAELDTVMMVGHNPEITALLAQLCPEARIDNVPTCGVMCLDYAVGDWSGIDRARPRAWHFDYPRNTPSGQG